MSSQNLGQARSFVQQVELPRAVPETLGEAAPGEQSPFDAAKQQAAIVGSDVMSFVKAITPEQRKDLVNASLLAQLVANKHVKDVENLDGIRKWYREYFSVLNQIGFDIQE